MSAHPRRAPARAALALAGLVAALVGYAGASPSAADPTPPGQLVSEAPAPGTPHVLDGQVRAVAQVGDTVVLGGTFRTARNDDSGTVLRRVHLLAFSATTGEISTAFTPDPNGAVNTVLPSGDGSTVYIGGEFTSVDGVRRSRVARISVADGSVVPGFDAGRVDGQVRDLKLADGRLWLAGSFTRVGPRSQRALTTVDPITGRPQGFMGLRIGGQHRRGKGTTQVLKIDVAPYGQRLVAIGNFHRLGKRVNHQLFVLDVGGAKARPSGFRTSFYTSRCLRVFDTYMRDVDFAPDGSYFVVGTTGAHRGIPTACDTVARFEAGASGARVEPSWVDYTGGDTTTAVEVAGGVVYVGGHQRWWNNPDGGGIAGPGAVSRTGLAALSPENGLPFSWDPTRTRGLGVFDFLMTGQGLWIASDTDRIGQDELFKGRIARMPRNGASFPALATAHLGTVYNGSPDGLTARSYDGSVVGPTQAAPSGGIDWSSVRGAFMINGRLYLAHADGTFTKRTFDGTDYGPAVPVDAADGITPLTSWQDDIRSMTGMFYDRGRIYFTRTGSDRLSYRYFNPESDIVGATRLTASRTVGGFSPQAVRGMFGDGEHLYWSGTDGALRRVGWTQQAQSGVPAGRTRVVSGPQVDGRTWVGGSPFLGQGAGTPTGPVADGQVEVVGAAGSNANTTQHRVTVPAGTAPGDTLVLTLGVNSSAVTLGNPPGWTVLDSFAGGNVQGRSWTRTATGADAGSTVTVPGSGLAKGDLSLVVYRGVDGSTSTVGDHAVALETTADTEHIAPPLTVPEGGGWVLTHYVAKTSTPVTWEEPPGTTVRRTGSGTGDGRMVGLTVDSGGAVGGGTVPGWTATTSDEVTRTLVFSLVVTTSG